METSSTGRRLGTAQALFAFTTKLAAVLLAVIALLQLPAFAQVGSSSLGGTVVDASGAVIPNARVELKDETTNVVRSTTTNSSGFFNFVSILPRSYTITISSTGFKTIEIRNIALATYESRSLPNLVLKVAGAEQAIEVSASEVEVVPLDTGENRTTLNEKMITNLMTQGRNAAELVKIMPGMGIIGGGSMLGQDAYNSQTTQSNSGIIGRYSGNGTQPYGGMQITLDGGVIVDTGNMGTQTANVNSDQISELTVRSSAFNAEYAHGPVAINATSKGGGSEFHGSAYIYTRNATFNSEDAYLKGRNVAKPNDHYWYPGFTLGGPIKKDKLFFFTSYEYMMQHPQGTLYNLIVPTDAMRNGDFSATSIPTQWVTNKWNIGRVPCDSSLSGQWYYNNFCGGAGISGGNVANYIDPNGLAYMKLMPAPNADPAATGGYNYQYMDNQPVNRWEFKARADYNVTQNTRLYVSYNRQQEKDINTMGVWWEPTGTLPYPSKFPASVISNLWSASATTVFTPTLTNQVTFNYTSFINPLKFESPKAVNPSSIGMNITTPFNAGTAPMIPNTLSWSGNVPMYWAPAFSSQWQGGAFGALKRVPSIEDNIAWVKGTHTMKFGFYWARWGNQQTEGTWDSNNGFPQGRYEFDDWAWGGTGNPLADMLIGHAVNFAQTSADPVHTLWFTDMAFYAQDQWKIAPRLTINYGIRFDHPGQWFPSSGPGLPVWDPSTCATGVTGPTCIGSDLPGFTWHGRNSGIPTSGYESASVVADPRVGAALDLFGNGRTVLRGGFGVYRYQFAYNSIPQDSPLGIQAFQTTCNILSWAQIGTDPACQPTTPSGTLPSSSGGLSQTALQKGDDRTPYTQNWNFSIDQALPWKSVFEIGYTGSRSRNMLLGGNDGNNVNKVPLGAYFGPDPVTGQVYCQPPLFNPAGCTSGGVPSSAVVHFRPYNYGNIQVNTHGSWSNYNALQASWRKQQGRVNLNFNYTFSKTLGLRDGQTDNGTGASGVLVDPFHLKNNYGVLGYDRTHIFNAAYIVNLPTVLHGDTFGMKALGQVVNGWVISGMTQWQSGAPIQTATNGDLNVQYPGSISNSTLLGTNIGHVMPILTCDPRNGLADGQYFNPNCFAPPTVLGQNGTTVWPYIKGPAYFNSDLGVYKDFKITERQTLQFRAQAFNFLNHPLWDLSKEKLDTQLNFNCTNCQQNPLDPNLSLVNTNPLTNGRALYKVGRRVMEFALKYTF